LAGPAQTLTAADGRLRAFVAVGLPDPQRAVLAGYLQQCAQAAPRLRWVAPESLHVTLRFLGGIAPATAAAITGRLRQVPFEPFSLQVGGLGSFGHGEAARVVWIGLLAGREPLDRLAAAVDEACVVAGAKPEDRPYNAHLTLARAREGRGVDVGDLPPPPPIDPWLVEAFALYQSRLGAGGAVYTVLERFHSEYDAG